MATLTLTEQLKQLDDARKLVLGDSSYFPQIIQGILPIIGAEARVELRRWGADFLAETFASPSLPAKEKESLSLLILETLKSMIENPKEDTAVVKSVVQTAASVYPLVFRWMYVTSTSLTHIADSSRLEYLFLSSHFSVILIAFVPFYFAKAPL